jgi:transcriptional regulator with XRE-family HTH domain
MTGNGSGSQKYRPEWFAGRLRELRLKARLSQAELAQRAGISQQAIGGIETGTLPRWDIVCALANGLGVTVERLCKEPSERQVEPIDRWAKRRAREKESAD